MSGDAGPRFLVASLTFLVVVLCEAADVLYVGPSWIFHFVHFLMLEFLVTVSAIVFQPHPERRHVWPSSGVVLVEVRREVVGCC